MSANRGIDFLLRIGRIADNPITIAGLQVTGLSINNEIVDITNKDTRGFRAILAAAGTKTFTMTANGIYQNSESHRFLENFARSGSIDPYSLISENGDTYEGLFLIASYERAGDHNTPETFTVTLENSGEVDFEKGNLVA